MNYFENLNKYSLFDNLTKKQIEKFHSLIKIAEYKPNELIIKEGETGDFMFLLIKGEVEITKIMTLSLNKSDEDTREKSFIRLSNKDYPFIGEMSFVQNKEKRSASVKAINNCVIGKIYNSDLTELFENNNEIGYKLMNNIARKIADDLRITNKNILKLTTALSLVLEE